MSFTTRQLSAVLFTILSLAASVCAQKAAVKVPRGSISGRVTLKDKGVPGVAVGLRKGDVSTAFEGYQTATTDPDGFYHLSKLAPGSYSITICAPAFVIPDAYGAGKLKSVLVAEGENVDGVNFALVRGGVITGRVTDADERPIIDQQVNVYPAEFFEQKIQRTVYAVGSVQTDDRGIYRMFGLAPGRYKVAVGRSDNEMNVTYSQARNVFYKQVFHPDVSDQSKATIVEVSEGGEANDIDITVGPVVQTFKAAGQLVDDNGQPVPNLRFRMVRQTGQRIDYTNNSAAANTHGEFIVEGLLPGRYAMILINNQNDDLRVKPFSFDVVDQDVTGLKVRVTRGASILGNVVLENQDQAILTKLLQLKLRAVGMMSMGSGDSFALTLSSPLGPDGGFRFLGLPTGTVRLALTADGVPLPPKGFTITRVERDGVVLPQGLIVKEGEQVEGVRVFVSYGTATLRGVVTVDNGLLPEKGRVFAHVTKPRDTFLNMRPAIVDERGRFLMEGVPAGTYELQVVVNLFGKAPRTIKREVTLQDGQTTEVKINIDLNEPPQP